MQIKVFSFEGYLGRISLLLTMLGIDKGCIISVDYFAFVLPFSLLEYSKGMKVEDKY